MTIHILHRFAVVSVIVPMCVLTAVCQTNKTATAPDTSGSRLPQIVEVDKPTVFSIDPKALPAPFASKSVNRSSSEVEQPANARLNVPKGFKINVFAEGGFKNPRWTVLAPNGDVFLSDAGANSVVVLRDANRDGVAEQRFVFSDKLSQPFGMAFHDNWLYVANTDSVVRFRYKPGQTAAEGDPEKLVDLTPGG